METRSCGFSDALSISHMERRLRGATAPSLLGAAVGVCFQVHQRDVRLSFMSGSGLRSGLGSGLGSGSGFGLEDAFRQDSHGNGHTLELSHSVQSCKNYRF